MSRELKRVAIDFAPPLGLAWQGYENPHYAGHVQDCPDCDGSGFSVHGRAYYDQWSGRALFDPHITGSVPWSPRDPYIQEQIAAKISYNEDTIRHYGTGPAAVMREAIRMCEIFNSYWQYHLSQEDVDALIAEDRLWEFTRVPLNDEQRQNCHENGWTKEHNGYKPTAFEVNKWAMFGFGHGSSNAHLVIKARCARENVPELCSSCGGDGSVWDSPENEKLYNDWVPQEPPVGEGWQLWETVSSGSPITPVFKTSNDLVRYLSNTGDTSGRRWTVAQAQAFLNVGHAFSGEITSAGQVLRSEEIALHDALLDADGTGRYEPVPECMVEDGKGK